MSDAAIKDIVTVARFGARLAALAVESITGAKLKALIKLGEILPAVPGLILALPRIQSEWSAMQDDGQWQTVVDAVKGDFDLSNDALEEAIEESINVALEILAKIAAIVGRWIAYGKIA